MSHDPRSTVSDPKPSLAERLGFAPETRLAVIHCDDIGMCRAANDGAYEALANGPATCGSLMVPCPWFPEAAARARAHAGLDLGVHLTLNSEWPGYRWGPVAGRAAVPSLLDDEGYLPRTTRETVERARPEEVAIELRAQIEHALAAGIDVTHIDAHMGTCFFPPFIESYVRMAVEFRLAAFVVRPDPAVLARGGITGEGAGPIAEALGVLDEAGIPFLDGFCPDSLGFEVGAGEAHNRARIERLRPGVSYLICHPARDGEELRAITPRSAHQRDFERGFYGGSAGRALLESAGVQTIGMRPIRDLVRGDA